MTRFFFFAAAALADLLEFEDFNVERVVSKLELKGWNFTGGVKYEYLVHLLDAFKGEGFNIDMKTWRCNLYKTQFKTKY